MTHLFPSSPLRGGEINDLVLAVRFSDRTGALSKPVKQPSPHSRSSSDQTGSGKPDQSRLAEREAGFHLVNPV
jgi:hypothetical protein